MLRYVFTCRSSLGQKHLKQQKLHFMIEVTLQIMVNLKNREKKRFAGLFLMDWFLQILKFGVGITFQQSHTQFHMWEYLIPQSHTQSHIWEYLIPQSHSHTLSHVLVWELELDFPSQRMFMFKCLQNKIKTILMFESMASNDCASETASASASAFFPQSPSAFSNCHVFCIYIYAN